MNQKPFILVAEDDKFYASLYTARLLKEGYDTQVVGSGDAVFHVLAERLPDVLVLDLLLPHTDGLQVLKQIRADDRYKDLKVLVFSNLGSEDMIDRVKALGVTDYLVKTNISLQEMVAKVKYYLHS